MSLANITERPYFYPAATLGIAVIIAALVFGLFLKHLRASGNTLTSTGSAKMHVTSDSVKLSGSVLRYGTQFELPNSYREIAADIEKVKAFLEKQGVTADEYTITPVVLSEQYQYGEGSVGQPKSYELRQTVTINSKDVEKITKLAENVDELAFAGLLFQSYGTEYLYSGLAEARVSLLGDALKDAKARVTEIAHAAGSRVGKLDSASSGVVQVVSQNSIDVADYGTYDTSTIEKDIMVTVRATFKVR